MGVFSWKCCRCDKPVLNNMHDDRFLGASKAVLFTNEGAVKGSYTGYGSIERESDGTEFDMERFYEDVRWVHQGCYRQGDSYDDFESADFDPGQGEFYDEDDLEEMFDGTDALAA